MPVERRIVSFGSLGQRAIYRYAPKNLRASQPAPLLYAFDGQALFQGYRDDVTVEGCLGLDITLDPLIAIGLLPPCRVVGLANAGDRRMFEYMPPWGVHKGVHGDAKQLSDALIGHIAPFIEAEWPTTHRYLLGASMGGLMAVHTAWSHPAFAEGVVAMSPAVWRVRRAGECVGMAAWVASQRVPPIRLWMDCGTRSNIEDIGVLDDGASEMLPLAAEIARMFGDRANAFRFTLFGGAEHHEDAWRERLPEALRFVIAR